jgi:hypothetical protein
MMHGLMISFSYGINNIEAFSQKVRIWGKLLPDFFLKPVLNLGIN